MVDCVQSGEAEKAAAKKEKSNRAIAGYSRKPPAATTIARRAASPNGRDQRASPDRGGGQAGGRAGSRVGTAATGARPNSATKQQRLQGAAGSRGPSRGGTAATATRRPQVRRPVFIMKRRQASALLLALKQI